ncbi:MAG: RpiB/LacA/LacB family sugar-phosphate isomerase [bacterium]|nr:RpiB/LacA/LacB family sugar-phosphate isomerase [bacterium]
MKSIVYIGADHAGFKLKEHLKNFLSKQGYVVSDQGNIKFEKKDDYPDYAKRVAQAVGKVKDARGILICNNGIGMSIAANKVKGVRAALTNNLKIAREAVVDDNANILCLGQGHINKKEAEKIVMTFLTTEFSNLARHKRRIKKIMKLEA